MNCDKEFLTGANFGGVGIKKVERYFYPAIFSYEEGQEIAIIFLT